MIKSAQLIFLSLLTFAVSGLLLSRCGSPSVDFSPEIEAQLPEQIDFNYHIKPILSDRCYACHGPDEAAVEAGLSLSEEELATAVLESGNRAIVPGKTGKSEMYHRITSDDPEVMMPPPESNLSLTELEIATLTRWIEQGAEYKPHWSFIPPKTPELPEVANTDWAENPVDRFVLARLERENLQPSPEAEKVQLLRRVTFDLTGLPPTLEEIDAFLADDSEDAYEKVVDRLLASPAYGERMATDWMDVARYADSHGYHADGYRRMWPWRDWVIKAFNENLPYDDFVTWQMAGDLLPHATQEQVLATGFHRNPPASSEAGIVPEEYRLEKVFDRANTTAKAFMGLTLECARCHDHKYDPISQKEFYQFTAFFNQVDELGMISNDGNAAPTMALMEEETAEKVEYLRHLIEQEEQKREEYAKQTINRIADKSVKVNPDFAQEGLVGHYPFDQIKDGKTANISTSKYTGSVKGEVGTVEGYRGKAIHFDNEYEFASLEEVGDFERTQSFSMGAWVLPEKREEYSVILGNAGGKNSHWRGYEMYLDSLNRVSVRLTHDLPEHCLQIVTQDSISVGDWSHLMFTYDGSSRSEGIQIFINGQPAPVEVLYNRLYKSIRTIDVKLNVSPQPIWVGRSHRFALDIGLFQGAIDEVRIYDRQLSGLEVAGLAGNVFWKDKSYEQLNKQERSLLTSHYLLHQDAQYQQQLAKLQALREQEHATLDTVPEIMVMREMERPRKTYVLDRGMYDAPTEEVKPGTLADMLPFTDEYPPNRLGLAQWLLDPKNPLTARVTVNRYWHMLFGRGLVGTLEDFGNQGDLPTHPELLDWLALEFINSGWDTKAMLRLIVTSATYRQSSVADKKLIEKDPENILLARGPSYRLPAEMIRDNALVASGLLVNKVGGPSVRTYQPEGLWSKTHFSQLLTKYEPDEGDKLYRRSLYTFVRRTAPPPTMTVLDASDRSMCIVRRQRTSTPLQALLLLNEPQLLEASRLIAERAIKEAGEETNDQINYIFKLLTSRSLNEKEMPLLEELFQQEYEKYQEDQTGAKALLQTGDYPYDATLELPKLAAMSVVTNIIMNYDEVYTKR